LTANNQINIVKKKNKNLDDSKSGLKTLIQKEVYSRPIRIYSNSNKAENEMNENSSITISLLNYYCFAKFCKKNRKIELFDIGVSLYRKRMDIVNVFTILLLTEKIILKIERQNLFGLNGEAETMPSSIIRVIQSVFDLL